MVSVPPEQIQAALTAIPIVVAAVWIVRVLGQLWRESLWRDAGERLRAAAERAGAQVVPLWNGWSLVSPTGARVEVRGGPYGHLTRFRRDGESARVIEGVPAADVLVDSLA